MSKQKFARSPLSSARGVATIVLHRVATEGAYASRALDAEIEAAGLSDRDARLATEIVYGTLRILPELDATLDALLTRGRPDPFTLAALRGAAYQARCLGRVPDHAIVQETVALVKQKRGEGLGKLTNAVLRRVVAARPKEPSPPTRLVVPTWVEETLAAGLGSERTTAFLTLDAAVPALCLRIPTHADLDAVERTLRAACPEAEIARNPLVPRSLSVRGAGDPRRLPGYAEGELAVQDEGAQLIAALVDARPGAQVLDACAGHGGKTLVLTEAVGPAGAVTAVDIHQHKLDQLSAELTRLRLTSTRVSCEAIDLSVGDGGLPSTFDRVLVDAPCTGLGTLRRRPEILLRLAPKDPARLAALQLTILSRALRLVRPGGVLTYAVCSGSKPECMGVTEKLEAQFPRIRRLLEAVPGVALPCDSDGVFRIGPWLGANGAFADVYQVVRWEVLDSHSGAV